MLVLARRVGERILIGKDITVTVVRINNGTVKLGIEAPRDIAVMREELTVVSPDDDGVCPEPADARLDVREPAYPRGPFGGQTKDRDSAGPRKAR